MEPSASQPSCRYQTRTADPEYGFDNAKVPEVECSGCNEPIGDEPWVPDPIFQRFGTMFFYHKRCSDAAEARDRKRGIRA